MCKLCSTKLYWAVLCAKNGIEESRGMKSSKEVSGEKSVSSFWLQSCRRAGLSRFRHVRSKPDQLGQRETKMSGIRTCRRQRLLTDHAVDGSASQAVSGCSYRLSLVFIGSSPSRNFRQLARTLLVVDARAVRENYCFRP